MATQADVRRIARTLPGAEESPGPLGFGVMTDKKKVMGFIWCWKERIEPKKPRVPNPKVLAARVASLDDKEIMLRLDAEKFFTEPHYNGFPAILIRLPNVTVAELRPLIREAWSIMAAKELQEKKGKKGKKETGEKGDKKRKRAKRA